MLKQKIPELCSFEYEDIPHGRVIFNFKTNKAYVYINAKLLKIKIAKQVAEFFELDFETVVWKKDPHYKT